MDPKQRGRKVGLGACALALTALLSSPGFGPSGFVAPGFALPGYVVQWSAAAITASRRPLPQHRAFDNQLSGDYPPGRSVSIVVRDWYSGKPLPRPGFSICSINAFQTQADEPDANRPDEPSNWPAAVVSNVEDPNWPGEFLIDLATAQHRRVAFAHVKAMIDRCAEKGFDGVEFDNLDSYTRKRSMTFGQREALLYATLLTKQAHRVGLSVAQKNMPELTKEQSRRQVGFDFAIAESCAEFSECNRYTATYGDAVLVVEYSEAGFAQACRLSHGTFAVVLRDRDLRVVGEPGYQLKRCQNTN
jgi:Glycoside-hydrolase family GH114